MTIPLTEKDVLIRIADRGMTFVYTVRSGGRTEETRAVPPVEEAEASSAEGYWGGSLCMD